MMVSKARKANYVAFSTGGFIGAAMYALSLSQWIQAGALLIMAALLVIGYLWGVQNGNK